MDTLNLFHTPASWDELMDWVDRHNRDDRPHLITAAAMGFNLAVKNMEHDLIESLQQSTQEVPND